MKNAIIIIPVYKPFSSLSKNELASLHQCFTLLKNHPICYIFCTKIEILPYRMEAQKFGIDIILKTFQNKFFKSLAGYNALLVSKIFYKNFLSYKYMLIYQTDCWLFKDELSYWCNKGFDYIGAPWFEKFNNTNKNSKFLGVGNGGFSLRKVASHYKAVTCFKYIYNPICIFTEDLKKDRYKIKSCIKLLLNLTIRNNQHYLLPHKNNIQEDMFFGLAVKNNMPAFKVAEYQEALSFAMETNAEKLFKENNDVLPFGCHAWEKYEPEFWQRFIKI